MSKASSLGDARIDAATRRESSERLIRTDSSRNYGATSSSSSSDHSRTVLEESDCESVLGFAYSARKKWIILAVVFLVQVSMNLNAAIYSNAVEGISEEFGVTEQKARLGQTVFLIAYGIGSELWAPWSEELGRWPVLQLSLMLVNLTQIPIALSKSFPLILTFRILGGLSSAGGSVTLGMISDMWKAEDQQHAVAFIVLASVMGAIVGPVVGGYVQTYLDWRWIFWVALIIGSVTQLIHFFLPETRTTVLVECEAKRRREGSEGEDDVWGASELKEHRFSMKEIGVIWYRPFEMFFREPIVLCLSLLSGFLDALIFIFLESFHPVFQQWGFTTVQFGLAFIPLAFGYFLAYGAYFPDIARQRRNRNKNPNVQPEDRLRLLLFLAPLETVGLLGFAWTSLGPSYGVPWYAPLSFAVLIGLANFAIYHATIDYMMAAYGEFSASATGGNALARDILSGLAALGAAPFYKAIPGDYTLEWPSTILAGFAALLTIPIYVFYANGPKIRERSVFASSLADGKKGKKGGEQEDEEEA